MLRKKMQPPAIAHRMPTIPNDNLMLFVDLYLFLIDMLFEYYQTSLKINQILFSSKGTNLN